MAKYTAVLEQGEDGFWSAYTLAPTLAIGVGENKEAALEDLKRGMTFWLEYMKETDQVVPVTSTEVVSIEIAA